MTANPVPLVLVVEPDSIQRDLIHLCLSSIGCDVILAQSPDQVIPLISKKFPSMLILDTFIPDSSGLEILNDLKQTKYFKNIIVLLISSFGFPDIIQKAKKIGVYEFLIKPIDSIEFSKRVKTLLKIN